MSLLNTLDEYTQKIIWQNVFNDSIKMINGLKINLLTSHALYDTSDIVNHEKFFREHLYIKYKYNEWTNIIITYFGTHNIEYDNLTIFQILQLSCIDILLKEKWKFDLMINDYLSIYEQIARYGPLKRLYDKIFEAEDNEYTGFRSSSLYEDFDIYNYPECYINDIESNIRKIQDITLLNLNYL